MSGGASASVESRISQYSLLLTAAKSLSRFKVILWLVGTDMTSLHHIVVAGTDLSTGFQGLNLFFYDAVCVCVCVCARACFHPTNFSNFSNIFPLSTNFSHFSVHFTFRFTLGAIFLRPGHFVQRCDRCPVSYAHKLVRPSSTKFVINLLFIIIWFFVRACRLNTVVIPTWWGKPYLKTVRKKCSEDLELSYYNML